MNRVDYLAPSMERIDINCEPNFTVIKRTRAEMWLGRCNVVFAQSPEIRAKPGSFFDNVVEQSNLNIAHSKIRQSRSRS